MAYCDFFRPMAVQPPQTQHMTEPANATPPEKPLQQQQQQRSRMYSAPSVAAVPLGLPQGVASVLAAAQRSGRATKALFIKAVGAFVGR